MRLPTVILLRSYILKYIVLKFCNEIIAQTLKLD